MTTSTLSSSAHRGKSSRCCRDEDRCRYQHPCQRRTQANITPCHCLASGSAAVQVAEVCGDRGAVFRSDRAPLSRVVDQTGNARLGNATDGIGGAGEITEYVTVCRDPTDDKFLDLAINGRADLILTGDKDLLVLNPFRGITIVAPVTFAKAAR
jgi:hypothetical protein